MKLYPKLLANFFNSVNPFFFSYFESAEYREELIDLDDGRINGGILLNETGIDAVYFLMDLGWNLSSKKF